MKRLRSNGLFTALAVFLFGAAPTHAQFRRGLPAPAIFAPSAAAPAAIVSLTAAPATAVPAALTVAPAAAPAAAPASPTAVSAAAPTAGHVFTANGIPQETEEGDGLFIVPNEHNTGLYAPILSGKRGALISVGTFRALNAAALGDFSHLVQFDRDAKVADFNRANASLIASSKDRFEYLALLLNKPRERARLGEVRSGAVTEEDFLRGLAALPPSARAQSPEAGAVKSVLDSLPVWKAAHFEPPRPLDAGSRLADALPRFQTTPEQWRSTFFGSDRLFSKVKAMAREGRIVAVGGDLTGDASMPALARGLKAAGVPVSAVDVSNAVQYFVDKRPEGFVKNLRSLPLAADASVLFTAKALPSASRMRSNWSERFFDLDAPTNDHWLYFAVPSAGFLDAARTGALLGQKAFMGYMKSLYERAAPGPRASGLVVP